MHRTEYVLLYLDHLVPLPIWIMTSCPFFINWEVFLGVLSLVHRAVAGDERLHRPFAFHRSRRKRGFVTAREDRSQRLARAAVMTSAAQTPPTSSRFTKSMISLHPMHTDIKPTI